MGGVLTVHISMAYIIFIDLGYREKSMKPFVQDCPQITCQKLSYGDLKIMFLAHIFGILTIGQEFAFSVMKKSSNYDRITVTFKNLNIFIYQFSLLYIFSNTYQSIKDCVTTENVSYFDACKPADYNDWQQLRQKNLWKTLQHDIDELGDLRSIEITIFYAQLLGIVSYIFLSKIFIFFKGSLDEIDPFQKILSN